MEEKRVRSGGRAREGGAGEARLTEKKTAVDGDTG